MKPTKQEKAEFRAGNKALKAEIKRAKKVVSKAKKAVKKEEKLIDQIETMIGKHYYQDHIQQPGNNQEQYTRWCKIIASAQESIQDQTARQDTMSLRIQAAKLELKGRKQALRSGASPEAELP